MELTTTIEARTRVSATLEDDGRLSVKVFGCADYAPGRSTTAEVPQEEVPEALRAQLQAALEAIRAHGVGRLGKRLMHAVHKSAEVAAAHGEV